MLTDAELETAKFYCKQLADYGVFLVPSGEVESWLSDLGVVGKSTDWLVAMFERMGSDSSAAAYVKPTDVDVWAFLDEVRDWLLNPNRFGIPQ